jgi:hypothetical protein
VYRPWTGERPAGQGCFYDAEDAALLARFAAAGRRRIPLEVKAAAAAEPGFAGARLTWIPFTRESRSLRDPSTGLALRRRCWQTVAQAAGSRAPRSSAVR